MGNEMKYYRIWYPQDFVYGVGFSEDEEDKNLTFLTMVL